TAGLGSGSRTSAVWAHKKRPQNGRTVVNSSHELQNSLRLRKPLNFRVSECLSLGRVQDCFQTFGWDNEANSRVQIIPSHHSLGVKHCGLKPIEKASGQYPQKAQVRSRNDCRSPHPAQVQQHWRATIPRPAWKLGYKSLLPPGWGI